MNSDEPNQTSPGKLSGAGLIRRFLAIGVALAVVLGLFAYVGGWLTPHKLTPARLADRFEQLNGVHPGFRRNHAKGVDVSGWFEANGQGVALSKAPVFSTGRVPVIGRFSFGGGLPYIADDPHAVRGLGLLFQLPGGQEWRTAMVNLPVFPVKTPQAFYELMLASAPDHATGKPDPVRMQAFLAQNPESAAALKLIGGQPMSSGFENSTFNSLNAFRFINAAGIMTDVRWSLVPVQPFKPVDEASPKTADTNFMFDALIAGVQQHPLAWHLILTIAQPGDPTADATLPWPPDRRQIDAGTLTINHIESDDTGVARNLNFDPLILPDGMASSDDPLLSARSAVYSQSFTRREGEPKTPAAVSPAETKK